jgi:hypothetical protein
MNMQPEFDAASHAIAVLVKTARERHALLENAPIEKDKDHHDSEKQAKAELHAALELEKDVAKFHAVLSKPEKVAEKAAEKETEKAEDHPRPFHKK